MDLTEIQLGINGFVKQEFFIAIKYCHNHEVPYAADFLKFFEGEPDKCNHLFVSFNKTRFYVKQLPKEYKPFSMNITCCPVCHIPIEVQFITYKGGISRYPKVKDMGKLKIEDIPNADISECLTIASR